ncbi:MAG: SDR family oxidoreductase [Chitinophagaceae bacterium]|nr:SDR family oxidoreductase [Anaerolineae bacterium]
MAIDLQGKVAFVTGSARRVGREIALEFARQGANLVIHHHASQTDAESAAEEARALGVQAIIIQGDQSKAVDVVGMFGEIEAHYGRLDILVNSAASFKKTPLLDVTIEEWESVIGTNLTGPFLCIQSAAHLMIKGDAGGAIINISDNSGLSPWKARPAHSISKAGVVMLTQVAALALADYNIRVNCVVPGPVLPAAGEPESSVHEVAEGLPLKRLGSPQNIADACVFLATSDFATGTILRVDGGEGLAKSET